MIGGLVPILLIRHTLITKGRPYGKSQNIYNNYILCINNDPINRIFGFS